MTQFGVRPWLGNPKFAPSSSPVKWPADFMAVVAAAEQRGYNRGFDDAKKSMIKEIGGRSSRMLDIAIMVADEYGLSSWEELRDKRSPRIVWARWDFWDRAERETSLSFSELGRFLGFNHSTVIQALRKFRRKSSDNERQSVNCGTLSSNSQD